MYYELKAKYPTLTDPVVKAAYFVYAQHNSYANTCFRSGFRGGHRGIYPSIIPKLASGYYLPNFQVKLQDWSATLAEVRPGDCVFLDPPYPGQVTQLYFLPELDWHAFFDAVDQLPVPWVMTIAMNDLAKERLAKYQQIHYKRISQINAKHFPEQVVWND